MTPLATAIYRVLRHRLATSSTSITYGELAEAVTRTIPIHRRSSRLHAALGEVTLACRNAQLPALPAIVWRAGTKRPSDGYYEVAHPRVRTAEGRITAWEAEHDKVIRMKDRFPAKLE